MGGRSRAAAQILAGKGFCKVYNLTGGIMAWNGHKAAGPAETGMILLRGDERPGEVITLAFGLEEGLRKFYLLLSETAQKPELAGLFNRLAEVEERHEERLVRLYQEIEGEVIERKDLERRLKKEVMEGGFSPDSFADTNREALKSPRCALDAAMMLEAQSMDLYERYADRSTEIGAKEILFGLAEEEKSHLRRLGEMLDRRVKGVMVGKS